MRCLNSYGYKEIDEDGTVLNFFSEITFASLLGESGIIREECQIDTNAK